MKSIARRFALASLYHLGGLWLWRWWCRNAIAILTVHAVGDEQDPGQWRPLRRRLAPQQLDATLRILSRHYRFISMAQAVEMLDRRRPLQPRSMVLTFDDGYRNQVGGVAALLARRDVPATVFVSTGHVQTRRPFWFDRLDYALQRNVSAAGQVTVGGQKIALGPGSRSHLTRLFADLRQAAKAAVRDDREMCDELEQLAARLEAQGGSRLAAILEADASSAPLTIAEIQHGPVGVTFGSHTVDHLRVHRLPHDVVVDQLTRSKVALEQWTGEPCRFFCYPDGGFDEEVAALVHACGYEAAVTTERGLNAVGDNPMTLRRIDVPLDGGAAEIVAQASGFSDWLHASRRRLGERRMASHANRKFAGATDDSG